MPDEPASIRARISGAIRRDASGAVTDASKRTIARIKAQALQAKVAEEREFSVGKLTAEVSEIRNAHRGGGDPLTFHLRLFDADGNVIHQDDHVVFNPPVSVVTGRDENGVAIVEENHRAALRGIVGNIARQVAK